MRNIYSKILGRFFTPPLSSRLSQQPARQRERKERKNKKDELRKKKTRRDLPSSPTGRNPTTPGQGVIGPEPAHPPTLSQYFRKFRRCEKVLPTTGFERLSSRYLQMLELRSDTSHFPITPRQLGFKNENRKFMLNPTKQWKGKTPNTTIEDRMLEVPPPFRSMWSNVSRDFHYFCLDVGSDFCLV